MGAWIEIPLRIPVNNANLKVAPFMGAWIEISFVNIYLNSPLRSHPLWVRGLKLLGIVEIDTAEDVAPFMGAWIEISW